jgi:hypothetical protein
MWFVGYVENQETLQQQVEEHRKAAEDIVRGVETLGLCASSFLFVYENGEELFILELKKRKNDFKCIKMIWVWYAYVLGISGKAEKHIGVPQNLAEWSDLLAEAGK